MTIIFFLALFVYLVICAVLVGLILMQEGKGGGLSGVMGSSMGETFGFGGASKQVRKYTAICAGVFMVMTIILTFLGEAALTRTASDFVGTDAAPAGTVPAPPTTVTPAANAGDTPTPGLPPELTPAAPPAVIVEETPAPAAEAAPATDATPPAEETAPETTPAPAAEAPPEAPAAEATPAAAPEATPAQ